MPELKPGYILHADSEWVRFHLTNSIGRAIAYCRGPGAPFQNVAHGGKLFFRDRNVREKEIAFWADFDQATQVTVNEAWEKFGRELGAPSRTVWDRLVLRLPPIANSGQLIVIRGVNTAAPEVPVRLRDVGVEERKNATKGWSIEHGDVSRLLGGTVLSTDIEPAQPGRTTQIVSRVVRDTQVVLRIKRLHNFQCQICGHYIALANESRYCEGHHLQPLGRDHNGPDVAENIICVCPNHHAACDFGAIRLVRSDLRIVDGHSIGQQYLDYHNRIVYRR